MPFRTDTHMFIKTRALRATLLATAGLFPLAQMAHAQAQDTSQSNSVAENVPMLRFVVTGQSSPDSIASAPLNGAKKNARDIRRGAEDTSDTARILADLPGVAANTGGGFSSMPTVRGLSEQRIRITVDGVAIDMACPNDMNSPLSYTDPQTLNSIAVVPGVSPVSMGGDNIGGVIAAESAPPQFAAGSTPERSGSASTYYRSNGNAFGGAINATLAGKRISLTYTGTYTQSENYDGGGNRGEVRSSEYAKTDQALALAVNSDAGLFQVKGGYHFSPYEGFVNQWMDMTSNRSWFVNGRWRKSFAWGDVDWSGNWRSTSHEMNFLKDKLPGDMPMRTQVHTAGSTLKVTLPLGPSDKLRLGAEAYHQWLNDYWPPVAGDTMMMGPNTFINVNGAHRDRIGAYGEYAAPLDSRPVDTGGCAV